MTMTRSEILGRIGGATAAIQSLGDHADALASVCEAVVNALAEGKTIYTCGNGGSAAEAMHLTEELIGFYRARQRPAQKAICLNGDPTALTCIANDVGFEHIFARQVEALLNAGDVLIALTTSGNSANIVNALHAARARGATTIGLLGRGGGACAELCDKAIIIDDEDTAHIQEAHLVIVHLVCEAVERAAS
jgi:D-sedoheptulose 7-phosphate isomerase